MEEVGTLKFYWKISDFSNFHHKQSLYSAFSSLGPYKWRIRAYPKGYLVKNHMSIFLYVADWKTLPSGWSRNAKFSLTVINQYNNSLSFTKEIPQRKFNVKGHGCSLPFFISHRELYDTTKGYLVEDACIIEANIVIYENAFVDGNNYDPTKEDMEAFFGDLNSVIFPKKVVSSEEEAREALKTIEEALNMVPSDVNTPGRMSQLTYAFDVLSSLDDCSVITSEQKAELLSMKDNFINLPGRAAKTVEVIKLFTEKEVVKKNLDDHKLVKCLIEFEKAKAETAQNEQDIAILEEQIRIKKRKREISFSMQKEMFKLSKQLKGELDVLVRSWPEYGAKTKAAKEEHKVIGMEWSKMKQLVSSLNKPFSSSS